MFQRKIKNRILIAEKLINRSLSGQRLGLIIHNHLTSQIHLCWRSETGKITKIVLKECSFKKGIGCVFAKH